MSNMNKYADFIIDNFVTEDYAEEKVFDTEMMWVESDIEILNELFNDGLITDTVNENTERDEIFHCFVKDIQLTDKGKTTFKNLIS